MIAFNSITIRSVQANGVLSFTTSSTKGEFSISQTHPKIFVYGQYPTKKKSSYRTTDQTETIE